MSPRRYELGKRAEAQQATRRRIVEATFELHGERGIAATTYRDIAERADVSLATVYRHFPTYEHVVRACGALTVELQPPLDAEAVRAADDPVAALVDAVFGLYDFEPGVLTMLRVEQRAVPVLAEFVAGADEELERLVRESLPDLDADGVATVVALLDEGVHRSLLASGLAPETARERIASVIHAWRGATT